LQCGIASRNNAPDPAIEKFEMLVHALPSHSLSRQMRCREHSVFTGKQSLILYLLPLDRSPILA